METARITLLTDFGTRDGYVAAMRGVIAAIAPAARVDDASHDIAPGDVVAAAWALTRYWRYYPPGTIHVVVVDPGVGTSRRALAAEVEGRRFVAPDNGVLGLVLDHGDARLVEIRETAWLHHPVSTTFHGRDVFAPAAAHLARGLALDALGPKVDDPIGLARSAPVTDAHGCRGRIVLEDRFGNLMTDIPADLVEPGSAARIAGQTVPVRATYGEVAVGALVALVGSSGYLEIAIRDGSAAERLGVLRGEEVELRSTQ